MIQLDKVTKSFGGKKAVDAVSFEASEREIFVLLGTSGCGKTTTLKMINRLTEADSGRILINGENILSQNAEVLRMNIGFVMQQSGLFPHYTVAQNIAVVPSLLRWNSKKIKERTYELIHKLHLSEDILSRFPSELSGGQQQRVGIARALIAEPPILLMDEPFGALDNVTKADIHKEFSSLEELKSKTTILVTHDVQEAFELGHKICLMHEGKTVQTGTPKDMLYRPANDFVKDFFAENRLLLEYKVTDMKDILPFIKTEDQNNFDFKNEIKTSFWQILQKAGNDVSDAKSFEILSSAFSEYRKTLSA